MKRKDLDTFESPQSKVQIHSVLTTPSRKRPRLSTNSLIQDLHSKISFRCSLKTLSNSFADNIEFTEIFGSEYIPLDIREYLINGEKKQFRIADIGNQLIRKIYQKPKELLESVNRSPFHQKNSQDEGTDQEENTWNEVPVFKLEGKNIQSKLVLCFLSGLLTRKSEAAIVPCNNDYNFFIFAHSFGQRENSEFSVELRAILVRRLCLIYDLDLTLVQARPISSNDTKKDYEKEFIVGNKTFYCSIREGVHELLQWSTSVFKCYVYTNSIYEYALEVCKILDPKQKTLLKGIDLNNEYELRNLIKSRELFPSSISSNFNDIPTGVNSLKLKDFDHFGLNPFETVILDDDPTVWKQRENLLPFDRIIACGPHNFYVRCREEIWNLFDQLHSKKLRLMAEKVKVEGNVFDSSSSVVYINHLISTNPTIELNYESEEEDYEDEENDFEEEVYSHPIDIWSRNVKLSSY